MVSWASSGVVPRRVLVHLNSAALGGTQLNALDLATAVREHGWESVLVVFRGEIPEGPSILPLIEESGLPLKVLPRHGMVWQAAPAMARLARDVRASVVHSYGSLASRPAYWGACALGRAALVQTVYEMQMAAGEKEHTPMVVGTGYLVDDLRGRPGPVTLISPPVDVDENRPDAAGAAAFRVAYGLRDDDVLLVTVTRLDRQMKARSVELAMETLMEAGLDRVTLVVVGGGDAEQELTARAESVNRATGRRAVVMTGPATDPRGAYAAADIVLGMGGSAARGLAFSKPLVVTGENGWFKLFEPTSAATLFRYSFWSSERRVDAAGELAGILRPLVDDDERRRELGAWGRDFAVASFSLAAMAARLAGLYDSAVAEYGPRQWLRDLPPELSRTERGLRSRVLAAAGG